MKQHPIAIAVAITFAVLLTAPSTSAKDRPPPEAAAPADVKPGTTCLLKAEANGMRYFLRVPRRYDAAKGARLIVFLHGSNMNGLEYLRSFEAKKWADEDILCCPNGENGADPFGQNNFSFGSAPLVAAVTEEVKSAFKITATYIGGHSQGGFLTYSVILNFPDLYQGAFPMAGDCWSQNEPNLWDDKPEVLRKQQEIAIAVIHGRADPVVSFSQGEHAYDCFRAMGWTKLRLLAPEKLGHQFQLSPVDEALQWLDAVNGRLGPKTPAAIAKWGRENEWGWVWHAVGATPNATTARRSAEAAAAKALPAITAALKEKPVSWIATWAEFRRLHGETETAKPLVLEYLAKRETQRATAIALFNEAQVHFRADQKDEAYKKLEKLRDEAPHTYQAYFAARWLAERK